MAKELLQIEIDSGLKKEFLECINRAYKGKTEEGIIDLIRVYVERAKGSPRQKEIKNKVQQFVSRLFLQTRLIISLNHMNIQ